MSSENLLTEVESDSWDFNKVVTSYTNPIAEDNSSTTYISKQGSWAVKVEESLVEEIEIKQEMPEEATMEVEVAHTTIKEEEDSTDALCNRIINQAEETDIHLFQQPESPIQYLTLITETEGPQNPGELCKYGYNRQAK